MALVTNYVDDGMDPGTPSIVTALVQAFNIHALRGVLVLFHTTSDGPKPGIIHNRVELP